MVLYFKQAVNEMLAIGHYFPAALFIVSVVQGRCATIQMEKGSFTQSLFSHPLSPPFQF